MKKVSVISCDTKGFEAKVDFIPDDSDLDKLCR